MIFKEGDIFKETFIITEEIYKGFICVFKDRNPLHISEDFARSKSFRGVVMHGNILNGFLSYFIGECLPTKDVLIHSQEINYKNACYLNDELHFTGIVTGIYESVNTIDFKFEFRNSASNAVAKGKIQIGLLT